MTVGSGSSHRWVPGTGRRPLGHPITLQGTRKIANWPFQRPVSTFWNVYAGLALSLIEHLYKGEMRSLLLPSFK